MLRFSSFFLTKNDVNDGSLPMWPNYLHLFSFPSTGITHKLLTFFSAATIVILHRHLPRFFHATKLHSWLNEVMSVAFYVNYHNNMHHWLLTKGTSFGGIRNSNIQKKFYCSIAHLYVSYNRWLLRRCIENLT